MKPSAMARDQHCQVSPYIDQLQQPIWPFQGFGFLVNWAPWWPEIQMHHRKPSVMARDQYCKESSYFNPLKYPRQPFKGFAH